MKNLYLTLLIISLSTNIILGQDFIENKNKLKIGLNAGPNSTKLRGDTFSDNTKSQTAFMIGFSLEYMLNEKLSILTSLNYENKSIKSIYYYTTSSTNPFYNYNTSIINDKIQFHNLNIPILLRSYFGSKNRFFINGGTFFNYSFDITSDMTNNKNEINLGNLDFKEQFEPFDFGLSLGFGTNFNLNNSNNLLIEIRDDFGISDIGKNSSLITTAKTNTIKLILNWNFNI